MAIAPPVLVADIGGTNARFALVDDGVVIEPRILRGADFPSIEAAVEHYLSGLGIGAAARPRWGAFAVAGPVTGDQVALTNLVWAFSVRAVARALGLERLRVVNDFTAVALSVPRLGEADRVQVGAGAPTPREPVGVIGPGSGLGVSGLVATAGGWAALSGEGGHVTMAPADDRESAVLAAMRARFGHVSAERVLSGPGLVNLYETLCALDGERPVPRTPAEVTTAARDGDCRHCADAVAMFCAMLGTVAGNLALTLGALGGIYIAGGIVPRLGSLFMESAFRDRFLDKGRMRALLHPVPTYVITHELPAFLGLVQALESADGPAT